MSTAKQDVEKLLRSLPDNVSVEDIQYHLYVLDKLRRSPGGCPRQRYALTGATGESIQQVAFPHPVWTTLMNEDAEYRTCRLRMTCV